MIKIQCPNCAADIEIKSYRKITKGNVQCHNCYKTLTFEKNSTGSFTEMVLMTGIQWTIAILFLWVLIVIGSENNYIWGAAIILYIFILYVMDKILERIKIKYQLDVKDEIP